MQFDALAYELERGGLLMGILVLGVTPEEAQVKPSAESWSMLEVVCHLYDEECRDFRKHLDHILQGSDQPPFPDVPQEPEPGVPYNERDWSESLDAFLEERNRSLAWLKALSAPDWDRSLTLSFGPTQEQVRFSAGDMLAAWVAHDHLHMRQLVELQRGRIVRMVEPYDVQYAGGW